MTPDAAVRRARELFLAEGGPYGCAEVTFMVLKEAYGLPDSSDPAPAMALNGGIAYQGGTCGAITGAALATGVLARRLVPDHGMAKSTARRIVADLMESFTEAFGAADCRRLCGWDLRTPEGHDAFMASGVWRTVCMAQIEFVVRRLADLPAELL